MNDADFMEMWERRTNERAQGIYQTILKARKEEAVILDGQNGHSETVADVERPSEVVEGRSGIDQEQTGRDHRNS